MPKIKCNCGNIIWLGDIPSPHQLLIIPDIDFDKYWKKMNVEELFEEMKIIVKCDKCNRLHIFWEGFDKPPQIYVEDPVR